MQLVVYCFIYPIVLIISKLPWRILYFLSSIVYLFIYYIVRYRQKTVKENLALVFPEKSDKERKKIMKASFKHMCDIFLEMTKSLSISEKDMTDRFRIKNIEMIHELQKKNKSIIVMMGHYNSYEWTTSINMMSKFRCVGVYKPIKNIYFDRLAHRIRARFGSILIPMNKTTKIITKNEQKENPDLNMYGLISDQSPKLRKGNFWIDFMGIEVPAFIGGEILSKRLDLAIYYLDVEKVKRGYYEATVELITEKPNEVDEFYITSKFTRKLEKQIRKNPNYYLWTHKRWKHKDAQKPKGATVK